ncbi:hypothetical protein QG37_07833 [Candidozyma auris]|nr:hypothetical protein QG37_07833 [[Candida] auris]
MAGWPFPSAIDASYGDCRKTVQFKELDSEDHLASDWLASGV